MRSFCSSFVAFALLSSFLGSNRAWAASSARLRPADVVRAFPGEMRSAVTGFLLSGSAYSMADVVTSQAAKPSRAIAFSPLLARSIEALGPEVLLDRVAQLSAQFQLDPAISRELNRIRRGLATSIEEERHRRSEASVGLAREIAGTFGIPQGAPAVAPIDDLRELSTYRQQRVAQLFEDGRLKKEYEGPPGYEKFADDHFQGNMDRAWAEVRAVLGKERFKALGWGIRFPGTTAEHREFRKAVIDAAGNVLRPGKRGYHDVSVAQTGGDMRRSSTMLSAVTNNDEFIATGWGSRFLGTATQFGKYNDMLRLRSGGVDPAWGGTIGLNELVEFFARGLPNWKLDVAKKWVRKCLRAVLTEDEIDQLGWPKSRNGRKAKQERGG